MLILRDMKEEDIEDYVRWFTTQTEWGNWDSPWEAFDTSEEDERKLWTEYYESVRNIPDDVVRWKYEIELDGSHIGWICSYTDLGYMDNKEVCRKANYREVRGKRYDAITWRLDL
jgi:RimJ/RimL family protein N-acetyltransferase